MGLLDDIAGFFGLGGGGGSSVTYGVTTTVQGGKTPVGLVSTLQGGDRAVVVDVGLDDVDVDLQVGGTDTPLHTIGELRVPSTVRTAHDLAVTEPIESRVEGQLDARLDGHLDVEPVQLDVCLDVGLTKLPKARIHQPYTSRFGVTVFGAEVVGFRWSGASDVIMDELTDRPHVELGPSPSRSGSDHPEDGLHVRLE